MERDSKSYFQGSKYVTELSPSDFDEYMTWKLKNKGCAAVLFYAPWCPYCKKVKDAWEELGKVAAFIDVYAMNCEKYKNHMDKLRHDEPALVESFPTMILYKDGTPKEKIGTSEEDREVGVLLDRCMSICDHS